MARRAVLLAAAVVTVALAAQSQSAPGGALEGKLTDLFSQPLDGVTVVLRNARTGAEFQAVTGRNGTYRLAGLVPGSYELEARSATLGQGRTDGIFVPAGHAARVQTAIALRTESEIANAMQKTPSPASSRPARPYAGTQVAAALPANQAAPARANPPRPAGGAATFAIRSEDRPGTNGNGSEVAAESAHEEGSPTGATGNAEVSAADPGASFATAVHPDSMARTGALMAAMAAASLKAALQMAALQAGAEATGLAAPADAGTLTSDQMEALPIPGRNLEAARLDDLPEIPAAKDADEGQEVRGRIGNRGGAAVDGADTRLAFGGRGVGQRGVAALIGPGGTETAVREMRMSERNGLAVETPAGEPGGALTRGGGDAKGGRLHGQAFFFARQNLLGAQNPLTQWVKETSPGTATSVPVFTPVAWSPDDQRFSFGVGAGSAILRHRLAWFAAFDGDRRSNPAVATVKHPDNFFAQPSNDEMQVLSARLRLGGDPVSSGIAAYSGMLESLAGLLGPAQRTSTRWTGFGRLDWNAAQKHRFTLEGTWARWDAPGGGLTRASETYGNHSFGASRSRESWILGRWETFPSPNLRVAVQGSVGRDSLDRPPSTPSAFEQTFNVNQWGQLPQMVVDSRYGYTIGNPAGFGAGAYPKEHLYEGTGTVDWVHGRVIARGGLDMRHNADATSFVRNHTGTYHYARVENFASDALVFAKFGLSGALDPGNQHNCDERGKAWRDTQGQLHGLGYLPCYSYYTQTLGPSEWHLETNDWAGFGIAQWQAAKTLVVSAGLRWEMQQTPPPIALVNNPDLPMTRRLPSFGSEWAPRVSLAWGTRESHWPVVRMGYGMYYGRTPNRILETALTQTGSPKGDVSLMLRPTDNLQGGTGGAPPFPYVLAGDPGSAVKPGAVEMAPEFRNAEVHQAAASFEEELPGRVLVSATAAMTLGRRLPVTMDTNFDPKVNPGTIAYEVVDASGKGPIKSPKITAPFYASWPSDGAARGRLNPNYQQITEMLSRANSTYEAAIVQVSRTGRRGLGLHARYIYGHTMDWNPGYGGLSRGGSVLDPLDFSQEYGTSDLDVRHSISAYAIWHAPWKLRGTAGGFANGWMVSGVGQFHSGMPFTMHTAGSLAQIFEAGSGVVAGLGPGMNGYGGDNRIYSVGRNTYRYPSTWKADVRVGKQFRLGRQRELDLMAESFNLFNHRNVTELETVGYYLNPGGSAGALPRLNFLTGIKPGETEFGQPLNVNATDSYRERQFDFGVRLRFKNDIEF